jgi:porin
VDAVGRPVTFTDRNENIPAVSGLLYATIFFSNGSLLSALPGYYNPGNGVTVNFNPTKSFYLNLGVYDADRPRSAPVQRLLFQHRRGRD